MCVSLFTLYYILHYFLFHIGSLFAHGCVLQMCEIANPKINVSLFPSFCLLVDFLLLRYFTMFSPQKKKKAFFWKRDFDFVHQWNTPVIFLAVIPAPLLTCLPVAPSGGRVAPVADQTVEFEVGIKIIKVLCLTNMQPDHEETLKPLTSHLYTFHCLEAFGNWDP